MRDRTWICLQCTTVWRSSLGRTLATSTPASTSTRSVDCPCPCQTNPSSPRCQTQGSPSPGNPPSPWDPTWLPTTSSKWQSTHQETGRRSMKRSVLVLFYNIFVCSIGTFECIQFEWMFFRSVASTARSMEWPLSGTTCSGCQSGTASESLTHHPTWSHTGLATN